MGLVVSRFAAADPLSLLPQLRQQTEARLRRPVKLKVHPGGAQVVMDDVTLVVLRDAHSVAMTSPRLSWMRRDGRELVRRVKDAMRPLAGDDIGWTGLYWEHERAPTIDAIAAALGARVTMRFEPSAVMTSGLRTPVEIRIDGGTFDLEAPIVIFGQLYERAMDAARSMASPVALSG